MTGEGRKVKSAKNAASGIGFRIVSLITAFIVRTVFIRCLGNTYLGVNGLFTSILSMLSLAELGFGTAMVYAMYKPLADKNYYKLSQLMALYKKAYRIIGLIILTIGLALIPFLDVLIKNKPDIPYLTFYYVLFLLDSVVSYLFFSYRNAILQADQRASVISNYSSIFNLIKTALQIILLVAFKNFTVYLLVQIGCTVAQNIALAIKSKKDYPVFSGGEEKLPDDEKKRIFKDVKALMIQKVSFKVLNTSDTLIISAFVGLTEVGLLSNYLLIVEAVVAVISQFLAAITASMGNYFAEEDKDKGYQLFLRINFLNFWIYGFCSIALITLLNPFINIWLGDGYVMTLFVAIAVSLRFFVEGYMNLMSAFRSTLGLFTQGKYFPLVVAAINIGLSIALSFPFGVAGVLIATPISRCCINVWYMPLVIYRDGFNKDVKEFYVLMIKRVLLLFATAAIMIGLSTLLVSSEPSISRFILLVITTAILPNLIFFLFLRRKEEFRYYYDLLLTGKNLLKRRIKQ